MYSIRKVRKVSLFKNFVLAMFLLVVCYMLTSMSAAYAAGGGSYALKFDGVDDYVDAKNIYQKLTQVTVEFWMWRPVSTIESGFILGNSFRCSNVQPIIASKEGFRFLKRLAPVGNLQFRVYEAEHDAGRTMSIDTCPIEEWAHIAGVFNANIKVMKMYVNGVEEISDDAGGAAHTGIGNTFRVGQNPALETCVPGTKFDEVRIWNYARTREEILGSMDTELTGGEEGLIGYWKFNEGEGATVNDSSPNQNHGTIKGATWTAEAAPVVAFRFVAYRPSPADGATDVPRDVVLGWKPGALAAPVNGHKIYLSENFKDVNDGVGGVIQDANSYAPPQRLNLNTTYYWRVDEVNGPPDYTVYKGDVWSFTTELIAYPIKNVTATASSQAANRGPENTVNGSGLDSSGLLHGKEGDNNMWLSAPAGPQPTWIGFEFDKVYRLHEMWVWNSNDGIEPVLGFGLKDVTIEYSANGIDYTTLGTTHQFTRAPGTDGYAHNSTIDFSGVAARYVRLTANSNWGGLMPQYGLSEVRFFHIPVYASEPKPGLGATNVEVDVVLGFRAGREAAQHDVYLGTNQQAVIDGTAPVTTVSKTSYGPLSLDLGTTYYWKINEVNLAQTPTMWEGDLWSFTTRQFFVVDDFESYNDLDTTDPASRRIFNTWIDGYGTMTNGSIVGYENPPFAERTIVHGSEQSMPLAYSNTAGKAYSEAERTFAVGQDWTKAGSQTLVLYFQGIAGNTGQLYVKINGSKVVYGGDAGDIAKTQWQQWNIVLSSLGVNLQRVTKLAVGIDGNGASGKLCFDDIRLYRLAP